MEKHQNPQVQSKPWLESQLWELARKAEKPSRKADRGMDECVAWQMTEKKFGRQAWLLGQGQWFPNLSAIGITTLAPRLIPHTVLSLVSLQLGLWMF